MTPTYAQLKSLKAGDRLRHGNGSEGVVEKITESWAIVRWSDGNREAWSDVGLRNGEVKRLPKREAKA